MPGYSGTPLPKKLGIKPPLTLVAVNAPREYRTWLGDLPDSIAIVTRTSKPIQAAHLFVTERAVLKKTLTAFRKQLDALYAFAQERARLPSSPRHADLGRFPDPLLGFCRRCGNMRAVRGVEWHTFSSG